MVKTLQPGQTPLPIVGTTVKFHIKVTNDGDTTLSNIVVTDPNAADCSRNPLKGPPDGKTGAAITLAPNASAEYDYELANVPITYTGNTATACGDDQLNRNVCDDDTVPVTPQPKQPAVDTDAGSTVRLGASGVDLTDTATLSGGTPNISGKIIFSLYRDGPAGTNCAPASLVATDAPNGVAVDNGNSTYSETFHVTQGGKYHWIANYTGDLSNLATSNTCGAAHEDVYVINPSIDITKTTSTPVVETGGTAHFHIKVVNTGNSPLMNVHIDDAQAPGCARTAADIIADPTAPHPGTATFNPGDTYEYDCALTGPTADYTNFATATGTPEVGNNVTDTDSVPVDIIHPHIDVTKDPKQQSIPSGGTAHFTIVVTNDGDTPLGSVTITDPNSPDCNRTSVETAALILTQTGHAPPLNPGESFTYACSLTNVTSSFTNVVTACGTDQLSTQVCDTDEVPNQIPNCPEPERCSSITVSGITTVQDPKPKDTATISGLTGTPGGTLTWSLLRGPGCLAANQVDLNGSDPGKDLTANVTQNGDYTVTAADFLSALLGSNNTAGTYNWLTSYSGDPASNNAAIAGTCGTENFTITNG